jgi:hypothetical protein
MEKLDKIDIYLNRTNLEEKIYGISYVFDRVLRLDYSIKFHEFDSYKIYKDGSEVLDIVNEVLSKDSGYERIGVNWERARDNLPFFGSYNYTNGCFDLDIFGSIFYFLSHQHLRILLRDSHDRECLSDEMIFALRRPFLNYYIEQFIIVLGSAINVPLKTEYKGHFNITIDVDHMSSIPNFSKYFKESAKDLLLHKDPLTCLQRLFSYLSLTRDPHDIVKWSKSLSKKYRAELIYFLHKPIGLSKYDRSWVGNSHILQSLLTSNVELGTHPSYYSSNSEITLYSELKAIKEMILAQGTKSFKNRHHFLRYRRETSWKVLESLGFSSDFSIGFSGLIGFPSGICWSYSYWRQDVRRATTIDQFDVTIMDRTVLASKVCSATVKDVISESKKFRGDITFVGHNCLLSRRKEKRKLLKYLSHYYG